MDILTHDHEIEDERLASVIDRLRTMACTDELTGLANRRWLNVMLERHCRAATADGSSIACLMIDLDGLKTLNDRCGHPRGDAALRLAGEVIRRHRRGDDVAARYGGDEFCVLMPGTNAATAAGLARRIRDAFDAAVEARDGGESGVLEGVATGGRSALPETLRCRRDPNQREPLVGMSIGVAHRSGGARVVGADDLLATADAALYEAKAAGKGRVVERSEGEATGQVRDSSAPNRRLRCA